MRIGENLPPFWQNVVTVLWVIGYGLTFIAAISSLWGWYVVGSISCLVLIIYVADDRKAVGAALATGARKVDRLFALYLLMLTSIAAIANAVLAGIWLIK